VAADEGSERKQEQARQNEVIDDKAKSKVLRVSINAILFSTADDLKVRLSGLPVVDDDVFDKDLNKALQQHMNLGETAYCKVVALGRGGTGTAVYASAEAAKSAIEKLNGSVFQDQVIEVTPWSSSKGEKKEASAE